MHHLLLLPDCCRIRPAMPERDQQCIACLVYFRTTFEGRGEKR
jgi:hypothetical protein